MYSFWSILFGVKSATRKIGFKVCRVDSGLLASASVLCSAELMADCTDVRITSLLKYRTWRAWKAPLSQRVCSSQLEENLSRVRFVLVYHLQMIWHRVCPKSVLCTSQYYVLVQLQFQLNCPFGFHFSHVLEHSLVLPVQSGKQKYLVFRTGTLANRFLFSAKGCT